MPVPETMGIISVLLECPRPPLMQQRENLSTSSLVLILIALAGCGGGGGGSLQQEVSVSPSTAAVQVGANQQFTAVVGNAANAAFSWQVNAIPGGNSAIGTISSSGFYLAPTTSVPSPATVAVTAVLQSDPSKTGSATVTIVPSLTITTFSLPSAFVGYAYSATLHSDGGTPPFTWNINAGTLPPGLTLNSAGVISGTPTATGD